MDHYHHIVKRRTKGEFYTRSKIDETLIDFHGNRHMVTYNKNAERPLLTDGWSSLRSFYGMTGDHVVCLRYVGDSTFQVNVFKKPSTPASFPRCHAKKERQLRHKEEPKSLPRAGNRENHCNLESSSFSITLTHYKATGSQLNLPLDFVAFLWRSGFSKLLLCGPSGIATQCALLRRHVPRKSIKIGKGWKQFCLENGLWVNDQVVFEFVHGSGILVNVKK